MSDRPDDGLDRAVPADAARERGARARRNEPQALAAIAAGGALGAPARYGVAQLIKIAPHGFPWATFWTNISGSMALGFLLVLILERFPPSRYLRPFVATGFLGAYTTYSTFAVETDLLINSGHVASGLAYAAASLVAGFLAVWIGMLVGRAVPLTGRGGVAEQPPDQHR